jgi:putative two-component system response regulator
VVLLDLVLPNMSGYEVCRHLKNDGATGHVPVIIMTGQSDRNANLRAVEAGADDFLLKPIDSVLLDARLRGAARTKRLHDELAAHRDQLEGRVAERTHQLERTRHVTMFGLAKLAESRDTETGEHLDRMRCYAREIALQLMTTPAHAGRIDQAFIDLLFYSSPLHDIGKVGIPDCILLKPGKLTKDEFEVMKSHSTIGGDCLSAADMEAGGDPYLRMGRDIAYYHHERWDGSGYPKGLAGAAIPLAARITALGDVYDALTSKRPYKQPFSHEKSRDIILEGRGSQFDPAVVDAFIAREENFVLIHHCLNDEGKMSPLQRLVEGLQGAAADIANAG